VQQLLEIRDKYGYNAVFKKFQKSVQSIKDISLETEKNLIQSFLEVFEDRAVKKMTVKFLRDSEIEQI